MSCSTAHHWNIFFVRLIRFNVIIAFKLQFPNLRWLQIYDLTILTRLSYINQEIFHYGISPFPNYFINSGLSNLFSHFQFLLVEIRKPRLTKT